MEKVYCSYDRWIGAVLTIPPLLVVIGFALRYVYDKTHKLREKWFRDEMKRDFELLRLKEEDKTFEEECAKMGKKIFDLEIARRNTEG